MADLQDILSSLLDTYGVPGVNPLDESFVADHTGLDAFFDDVNIEIVAGNVTFTDDSDKILGVTTSTDVSDVTYPDILEVFGDGYVEDIGRASLTLEVYTSPLTGTLVYYNVLERLDFESTSITGVTAVLGGVEVTGEGTVNEAGVYSFRATIMDGSIDAMGIEIFDGGITIYNTTSQAIASGDYTVGGVVAADE